MTCDRCKAAPATTNVHAAGKRPMSANLCAQCARSWRAKVEAIKAIQRFGKAWQRRSA